MEKITAGRLLRSNTRACVVGCRISESPPPFGAMVYIPVQGGHIFGLIYDIHIDDDGLVRQLAAAENISDEIILDNRLNRNTPLEMSILFIGFEHQGVITHQLPPHPPLSLDTMHLCDQEQVRQFTNVGNYGYFRYLLTNLELPIADLIAAHISMAGAAQGESRQEHWKTGAVDTVITLLRDNHDLLNQVLFAISDVFTTIQSNQEN